MRWSLKLGRLAGVDVHVHATFGLLVLWVGLSELARGRSPYGALVTIAFVGAIFATIVLHELGHALTARRFGIRTRDITLYPIGGVSRFESSPDRSSQELLVAVAGPAVNFVIAALLFVGVLAVTGGIGPPSLGNISGAFVLNVAWTNVAIGVFNLIPAFPMDGGRVVRAMLAMRFDYLVATRAAARLGQALAVGFGILGLFYNPFLVLIALFVWVAASSETYAAEMRAGLKGIPVSAVMQVDVPILSPGDPISSGADVALTGFEHDFPVVDDGRPVGVLTRARLLQTLAKHGGAVLVRDVMVTSYVVAEPTEMLSDVVDRLAQWRGRSIPVVSQGRVIGLLAMEKVVELMSLRRAHPPAQPSPRPGFPPRRPAPRPWWRRRPRRRGWRDRPV